MLRPRPLPCLLLALGTFAGCRSASMGRPFRPLTPEERERAETLAKAQENMGRIDDPTLLFLTLDQNLRTWRELSVKGRERERLQLSSMEIALSRLVYNNFDTLLAAVKDGGDPEHRTIAAAGLGFARFPPGTDPPGPPVDERALEPLVALLEEPDDALIQNALMSLARLASPRTPVPLLLEMTLSHHNANVRSNAALALSHILTPEHRDLASTLYAALEDPEPKVRLHTVTALGRLGDPGAVGRLIGLLDDDPTPLVKANAARILGDFRDQSAVPYLAEGLTNDEAVVRVQCWESLKAISGEDLGTRPDAWLRWYQDQRKG